MESAQLTIQQESVRFETMITEEAAKLVAAGKTGLVILPGVHDLLTTVSGMS